MGWSLRFIGMALYRAEVTSENACRRIKGNDAEPIVRASLPAPPLAASPRRRTAGGWLGQRLIGLLGA
eukprot:scaffold6469_cov62-Phaeocystis_antarctica.AAC.2